MCMTWGGHDVDVGAYSQFSMSWISSSSIWLEPIFGWVPPFLCPLDVIQVTNASRLCLFSLLFRFRVLVTMQIENKKRGTRLSFEYVGELMTLCLPTG